MQTQKIVRTIFGSKGLSALVAASLTGLMALWPAVSQAVPVFEQLPLDGGDAFASVQVPPPLDFLTVESADDFQLLADTAVSGIRFWGNFELDSPLNNFDVRIFEDAAGVPQETPLVEHLNQTATRNVTPLLDVLGFEVLQFDLDLPAPTNLMAGQNYYLSVVFPTLDPDEVFYWLLSSDTGDNFLRIPGDPDPLLNVWNSDPSGNLAFVVFGDPIINGTIPEPATLGLMLAGFTLLLARRRVS